MQLKRAYVICYIDSTLPLLPKFNILRLSPLSLALQPGLCLTQIETPEDRFHHEAAEFVSDVMFLSFESALSCLTMVADIGVANQLPVSFLKIKSVQADRCLTPC